MVSISTTWFSQVPCGGLQSSSRLSFFPRRALVATAVAVAASGGVDSLLLFRPAFVGGVAAASSAARFFDFFPFEAGAVLAGRPPIFLKYALSTSDAVSLRDGQLEGVAGEFAWFDEQILFWLPCAVRDFLVALPFHFEEQSAIVVPIVPEDLFDDISATVSVNLVAARVEIAHSSGSAPPSSSSSVDSLSAGSGAFSVASINSL